MDYVLPHFNLVVFDSVACGLSGGEYLTLGIKESDDLNIVLNTLRRDFQQTEFYLWGRSMGAVTAILHLSKNLARNPVEGVVLDSPFTTAKTMICDRLYHDSGIPRFLTKGALFPIQSTIHGETGVDVLGIKPRKLVKTLSTPACFMVAVDDKMVDPPKFKAMFDRYKTHKKCLFTF